jgi:hypothetical protein
MRRIRSGTCVVVVVVVVLISGLGESAAELLPSL